jgi:hypothetical protein
MEGQINKLQKKLGEKDNEDFKEKNELLKFNEGSLWMSKLVFDLVGRCFNEMENLKRKVDDLFDDYQNRVRTTSFGEFDTKSNNQGWFMQMLNSAINQTLEKFKDFHSSNIKTVESIATGMN